MITQSVVEDSPTVHDVSSIAVWCTVLSMKNNLESCIFMIHVSKDEQYSLPYPPVVDSVRPSELEKVELKNNFPQSNNLTRERKPTDD